MPESKKPQYEIINTSTGLRAVPVSRAEGRVRHPVTEMVREAEKGKA